MNLFSDMIQGFIILALLSGIYGFTTDMMKEAGKAQRHGIMNYSEFTKTLTEK